MINFYFRDLVNQSSVPKSSLCSSSTDYARQISKLIYYSLYERKDFVGQYSDMLNMLDDFVNVMAYNDTLDTELQRIISNFNN